MADTGSGAKVLLEPEELAVLLDGDALVVDLRKRERYDEGHVAGAVHLDTGHLVGGVKPSTGKLPDASRLCAALAAIGVEEHRRVVGYDDEGSGWAGRLLWTMHMLGHYDASVLNGGIDGWTASGRSLSQEPADIVESTYSAAPAASAPRVTRDEILAELGGPSLALLDARTPEEYEGSKVRARRGGHIPGAVNLNWKDTMDEGRQRRLLPDPTLRRMLLARRITPEKQVVVYCHTHHRSAHSYLMLKHLGYPSVRAYDGSWSEWGNDPGAPIET